jgi:hypothetical protein
VPNLSAIRKTARAVGFPVLIEPLEARRMLAVDLLSYHGGDLASNGVNANETLLTPGNVKPSTFGKQLSFNLDGQAYAEPLVKTALNITTGANQGIHDVVFVATEHDSLYALDANGATVLWKDSFIFNAAGNPNPLNANIPSGVTSVPNADVNSANIAPEIGITSTPTIDAATGMLYLTAKTKEVIGGFTHYIYRLHKIDIHNGADTSVIIGDTIVSGGAYYYRTTDTGSGTDPYTQGPGTGSNGDGNITSQVAFGGRPAGAWGGQHRVYFNALRELQRPGLVLYNGHIYIAFGSHGDNGPYHPRAHRRIQHHAERRSRWHLAGGWHHRSRFTRQFLFRNRQRHVRLQQRRCHGQWWFPRQRRLQRLLPESRFRCLHPDQPEHQRLGVQTRRLLLTVQ